MFKRIFALANNATTAQKAVAALCAIVFTILGVDATYAYFYKDRIYQGVSISGVAVGGETIEEAKSKLQGVNQAKEIILVGPEETYPVNLESVNFSYNFDQSTQDAFAIGRNGNYFQNLFVRTKGFFQEQNTTVSYNVDDNLLRESLSVIAGHITVVPIYPTIHLDNDSAYVVNGSPGRRVSVDDINRQIRKALENFNFSQIQISVTNEDPTLTAEEISALEKRANAIKDLKLAAVFEDEMVEFVNEDLLVMLAGDSGSSLVEIREVADMLAKRFNRDPQNPVFEFVDGRVKEFLPSKTGVEVQTGALENRLSDALLQMELQRVDAEVEIPFTSSKPDYDTADINDLGIKELIGKGTSIYKGSIPSRVFNVALGASKFHGVLVAPGATLSFNNTVGDVSSLTGYKQAYVIKDGATVLGDGGGLCQVSTTLFRAALNAGLPIAERRAHSYRVGYYEQDSLPGLDATVYAPSTDFKFVNDTPAHILIQAFADSKATTLRFEIYGTSDGRVSTISKPVVSGIAPPPESLYIDDPTKPVGAITQIDWAAWGAKSTFEYTVTRDGEVIYEKTFYSNYRPWQAKFLRGTAPVN